MKSNRRFTKRKMQRTSRPLSRYRRRRPITNAEMKRSMASFYLGLEPLIKRWQKAKDGGEKGKLIERIKNRIKLKRRIVQSRIAASLPPFERYIIDTVFSLATKGVNKQNILGVNAQILSFVKKEMQLSDTGARGFTVALLDRLAGYTGATELRGGELVNDFFRQYPDKHNFFMQCLDAFSGAENVYHTNISTYLQFCKMYIEQGL